MYNFFAIVVSMVFATVNLYLFALDTAKWINLVIGVVCFVCALGIFVIYIKEVFDK